MLRARSNAERLGSCALRWQASRDSTQNFGILQQQQQQQQQYVLAYSRCLECYVGSVGNTREVQGISGKYWGRKQSVHKYEARRLWTF